MQRRPLQAMVHPKCYDELYRLTPEDRGDLMSDGLFYAKKERERLRRHYRPWWRKIFAR